MVKRTSSLLGFSSIDDQALLLATLFLEHPRVSPSQHISFYFIMLHSLQKKRGTIEWVPTKTDRNQILWSHITWVYKGAKDIIGFSWTIMTIKNAITLCDSLEKSLVFGHILVTLLLYFWQRRENGTVSTGKKIGWKTSFHAYTLIARANSHMQHMWPEIYCLVLSKAIIFQVKNF